MEAIRTYLFAGFLDAGKTSYIQDAIFHDYFYKRGKTLIISFEQGENDYDETALENYNTFVEFYEGGEDITAFCLKVIEKHQPARIYVEENIMIDNLSSYYPEVMKITAKTALISGENLFSYFNNLRQMMQIIVSNCQLVIFNRIDDISDLKPYGNGFKLLNNKTSYLWESPSGYHQKAFGVLVNYDKNADLVVIGEEDYPDFYLDLYEDLASYNGKIIEVTGTIQLENEQFYLGNMVMSCCAADMQFIKYRLKENGHSLVNGTKVSVKAKIEIGYDEFRRQQAVFEILEVK